jgi:hypothetical protein
VAKIYEDSRQKIGKHEAKRLWFADHGVEVVRKKLDFGDYMADGSNVSIDTKRNLQEVAMDCGRDHARFAREMDRARDAGHRLVILVEVGGPYRTIEDVRGWVSDVCRRCDHRRMGHCDPAVSMRCRRYRCKPMQGGTLAKIMERMQETHGCVFELVRPHQSARRICEWLGVTYDE